MITTVFGGKILKTDVFFFLNVFWSPLKGDLDSPAIFEGVLGEAGFQGHEYSNPTRISPGKAPEAQGGHLFWRM